MANRPLGKIEYLKMKDVLHREAKTFTPWLASPDGLELLGEALGSQLTLDATEKKVGPFSADMVLHISDDPEHVIVVENQYGKTDHPHLGKLLTYAAGLQAKSVVWIAENFQEEHRKAVDWLNEQSGGRIQFMAFEVVPIRIGKSKPALQLQAISSPNVWEQAVQEVHEERELSVTRLEQQKFWEEVREYVIAHGSKLRMRKPPPQHWYDISIGSAYAHIALTASSKHKRVGCELYIPGAKAKQIYDRLSAKRNPIQKQIGAKLEWQPLEGRAACRIAIYKDGSILNAAERVKLIKWLHLTAEHFHRVFLVQLKAIHI